MASLAWKLRVYWKRYTFAAVASVLVAKYTAKKIRENNIIRAYCNEAKRYGEERVVIAERDGKPGRARKVMVFLNPSANKRDAKVQFLKYSAPLFHLSGTDITIVEGQREGHLRSLMNYIDPQTDCIVVAGGDGTLMEVVTGLMRRTDAETVRSIPIGVIPLGKENRFYRLNLSPTGFKSPVRTIGDATMDIIRGELTTPMCLMEIKPQSGRPLCALSSVQWGPLRDAYENRDGFRLFGKLRLLFSHINVALRRWPTDYTLHVWHPRSCQLRQDSGAQPPSCNTATPPHPVQTTSSDPTHSTTVPFQGKQSLFKKTFTPVEAHCLRPQYSKETEEEEKKKSSSSSSSHTPTSDTLELTTLASAELEHRELKVMGFGLTVRSGEGEDGRERGGSVGLELSVWLDGSIHRTDFIKKGWVETMGRSPTSLPCLSLSSPHLVLQPHSNAESWVSIDGEVYETMPISVTAVPSAFRMYTRYRTH